MNRHFIVMAIAASALLYSCEYATGTSATDTTSPVGEWAVDTMWLQMLGVTDAGDTSYNQFVDLDTANNGVLRFQADGLLVVEHPGKRDTSSWTQSGTNLRVVESGSGKVTNYSALITDSTIELFSRTDTTYSSGVNQMTLSTEITVKAHHPNVWVAQ